MDQMPLVSIIINNYNYERFLAEAIESALQQTYRNTEVIVVDDGSTDASSAIIASYGGRIMAVLKKNGGQASALNAGFTRSHGDIVIFLDADDVLLPHIVERVATIFSAQPDLAKVQYRMAVIDGTGKRTGAIKPPQHLQMPTGDFRHVLEFYDDMIWQSTSGNAFAARVLRHIFPVPEDDYALGADYYVSNLPLLFGTIHSFNEVGACYRVHRSPGSNNNNRHTAQGLLKHTRRVIRQTWQTHNYLRAVAEAHGFSNYRRGAAEVTSVPFLARRMISLKLDPLQHPVKQDRLLPLFWLGVMASIRRTQLSLTVRIVYVAWFVAMLLAPRPLAQRLGATYAHVTMRSRFNNLLRALQAMQLKAPRSATRAQSEVVKGTKADM